METMKLSNCWIFRHGWKKLYIVVSSRKIIMFNSEQDRQNSDPTLILDLNKVALEHSNDLDVM